MADVLDTSCKPTLAGPNELRPGALGQAVQAQLSLRWADGQSPDFVARLRQAAAGPLAEDQQAESERPAEALRRVREEMQARDRAPPFLIQAKNSLPLLRCLKTGAHHPP